MSKRTSYIIMSSLLVLVSHLCIHATHAADVKVTDSHGESFTLTQAATIHYNMEGSLGGSTERIAGLRADGPSGQVEIPWGNIRQLQLIGPKQIKVIQVDTMEQEVFFDLQGLTGQRDRKTVTMNLDEIQQLEVVQP